MEKKKRMDWVDAARGIGILLIVVIHSIRPDMREKQAICRFIYDFIIVFVIGMFFVLSGVTYRISAGRHLLKPGGFLYKKVQKLLIPFWGYAVLIYMIFSFVAWFPLTAQIFWGTEYGSMTFGEYLWLTLCADSPYAAHLWFIWVLFWIIMIVYICDLLCEHWKLSNQKVLWCVAAILCAAGFLEWGSNSIIQRILTHMIFFVYGTELALHSRLIEQNSICSKGAIIMASGVMFWYISTDWHTVTWYGEVLWKVCWLLVRLTFIRGVFRLAVWLKDLKWLTYLGRESFWIYLLHQPFCCGFMGLLLFSKLGLSIPLVCVVCISLGLLLPLGVVWFVRRVYGKLFRIRYCHRKR